MTTKHPWLATQDPRRVVGCEHGLIKSGVELAKCCAFRVYFSYPLAELACHRLETS